MKNIISRIAPTPSGFLHAGNVYNFLLTYLYTRYFNGKLCLRIDDYDLIRYRKVYVQNIFDVLEFLGIDYDYGARNLAEFEAKFSSNFRRDIYKNALLGLNSEIYACECAKKTPNAFKNGIYQRLCVKKGLNFIKYKTALRLLIDKDSKFGARVFKTMGDFVLWKKDDSPAYNLASVVDDEILGVNFIVRGRDLISCTRAQIYLAKRLNFSLLNAKFIHHDLIKFNGVKLSKTSKAPPINLKENPQIYYRLISSSLGLNPLCADSLSNLSYEFKLYKSHKKAR